MRAVLRGRLEEYDVEGVEEGAGLKKYVPK